MRRHPGLHGVVTAIESLGVAPVGVECGTHRLAEGLS